MLVIPKVNLFKIYEDDFTEDKQYIIYGIVFVEDKCLYQMIPDSTLDAILKVKDDEFLMMENRNYGPLLINSDYFDIVERSMHGLSYFRMESTNMTIIRILPQSFIDFEKSMNGCLQYNILSKCDSILECLKCPYTLFSRKAYSVYLDWVKDIHEYYGLE